MLKPESIGEPTQYMGAEVGKYKFDHDPNWYWYMGSEHYAKEAVRNVENYLEKYN